MPNDEVKLPVTVKPLEWVDAGHGLNATARAPNTPYHIHHEQDEGWFCFGLDDPSGFDTVVQAKNAAQAHFDRTLSAIPSTVSGETQESIGAWADEVFGKVADLPRAVGRAAEELDELKEAVETLTPDDMIVEMADVVIVLMRLANVIGRDLTDAINAKMAVNRKRVWNSDGTGHGYHVKASPANPAETQAVEVGE